MLRTLEQPGFRKGFEARLGDVLAANGLDAATPATPVSRHPQAILPTRALCRALGSDAASTGGDLAVSSVQRVAESARPATALDRAGVIRLEVGAGASIAFPTWDPESTAGSWIAEGGAGYDPDLTVRQVDATMKICSAHITISRRLRQAVADVEANVLLELQRSVAGVIETGFLNGSGSEHEPLGLCNVPAAHSQTFGAAVPTRTEIIGMLQKYAAAHGNLSRATWVVGSTLAAALLLAEVTTGSGQFLASIGPNGQPLLAGVPVILSDYMPADKLLLIDPTTIRTVFWGAPYAMLDKFSGGMSINGSSCLIVYNACDVVSLQPLQIVVGAA